MPRPPGLWEVGRGLGGRPAPMLPEKPQQQSRVDRAGSSSRPPLGSLGDQGQVPGPAPA